MIVPLVGCSSLLGIQDPVGDGSGTGTMRPDGGEPPPDGTTEPMTDHLEFSVGTAVSLMKSQHMRFRVTHVDTTGTRTDVTGTSALTIATQTGATLGTLDAGAATLDTVTDGAVTITAKLTGATLLQATLAATVTTTPCHPVINEFTTGGALGPEDEFVEIYNPCTGAPIDVTGWTLDYRAATTTGTADSSTLATLDGTMASGDLRVYAGQDYVGTGAAAPIGTQWGNGLQQAAAAVGLRSGPKDSGTLVDSVGYGGVTAITTANPFVEKAPLAAMANSKAAVRGPFDGNDTGNNSTDFAIIATPTPGVLNEP
jgi:hypothetical protein